MFTQPKAAAAILGALVFVFVVETAQATNTAWRTSKNGWSTEHTCERNSEKKRCWTMTRGRAVLYPGGEGGATLLYDCTTRDEEWLYISMFSSDGPRRDITTLKARWGRELRDSLKTSVTETYYRGKSLYLYYMGDTEDFINKMKEHRTLNVFLPFTGGQHFEVRFKLANAIPSIQQTMRACHINRSVLGDIAL